MGTACGVQIVVPFPKCLVNVERRGVAGRSRDCSGSLSPCKLSYSRAIDNSFITVVALVGRAATAFGGHGPVSAVYSCAFQKSVICSVISLWKTQATRNVRRPNKLRGFSYNANREETTVVLPFGHATVSGFHTIVPAQANPAHVVFDRGAVIDMIASYGSDTFIGSATPKLIPVWGFVYDE